MLRKQGMTLIEIIIVLIIIGIAAVFCFPNFTVPNEQALAAAAQNNLLAIYTAEQNFNNNVGSYCVNAAGNTTAACAPSDAKCADTLAAINCNLSLNIQDDGTYAYICTGGLICTATRNLAGGTVLTLTLNAPSILIDGNPNQNPTCAPGAGFTKQQVCP